MFDSTAIKTVDTSWRRPGAAVQRLLHRHPALSPAIILALIVVAFTIANPRFANPQTLSLLLQQTAVVAALAVGQTLIILTAGIDLSVGAVAILSSLVMAQVSVEFGMPGWAALLVGVVVGAAAGAANGALVTRLSLPPFIVTLGTLSIFTAIGLLLSGAQSTSATEMPALLSWTGQTISLGSFTITTGVLLVLVMYIVIGYALTRTAWGTHVYAVGGDAEAARLAGIRVRRVVLSVYLVAGITYAIAAWVLIGRANAATPNGIVDGNLQSITAVVIGGTSLFGGRGGVIGTLIGAVIVQSLTVGLSLAGVDAQYRLLAVGVLVLFAVALDQWIRKSR
ncbi:ABC transporter permease [Agromyces mangrovi Wang et al. 2018]|uniref:ABC transporter permease n=1 Tax=Agromyces mangrovi TaxID=1858653 RepID=UPI0025739F84|nr:ABC transporter permease [Agromyces mangrovi]BDZ64757.1 ABC transporter permease [Agromyces mangrovi]